MRKVLIISAFLVMSVTLWAQNYSVELNILNTPNENGRVVLIAGEVLNVEYTITDPDNELTRNDIIQLIKVSTDDIIASNNRGNSLSGTMSFNTNGSHGNPDLGEFVVQYINNNTIIAETPNITTEQSILIVTDEIIQDIISRVDIIEQYGNGWSPAFSIVEDGTRSVMKITDWIGGTGMKPVIDPDNCYLGINGVVALADAIDIRGSEGSQGIQGIKGDTGDAGPIGPQGPQGENGLTGDTGLSAYEIWLNAGNTGTEVDFIALLKGDKGDAGPIGPQGLQGETGATGLSAYEIWLNAGNIGTEIEFIDSLKGDTGDTGPMGQEGPQGIAGTDGDSAYKSWLYQGNSGSEADFLASLKGEQGKSAYEIWAELQPTQQVITNGLVAYYPFNGNANDESSNTHHGLVNGATLTSDKDGNLNASYSFDGIDDYILVDHTSDLNMENNELTICSWVNWQGPNGVDDEIVSKDTGYLKYGYQFRLINGSLALVICDGGNYTTVGILKTESQLSYGWHHVAGVYSDQLNLARLYIDGMIVAENTAFTTSLDNSGNTRDLSIGSWYQSDPHFWNGSIDEVFIYNRALTDTEVQTIFNSNGAMSSVEEYLASLKGEKGEPGDAGPQGPQGLQGEIGATGPQGPSGSNGPQGVQGIAGVDGIDGTNGTDGDSAYVIWLNQGNIGSEQDYLNSLRAVNIEGVLHLPPQAIEPAIGTLGDLYVGVNKKLYFNNGDVWCEVLLNIPFALKYDRKWNIGMPVGVNIGVNNTVYVTSMLGDASNSAIAVYNSNGELIYNWGSTGSGDGQFPRYSIKYIAVDNDGYVYAVDRENKRVQKFSSDGTFIMSWGGSGYGNGYFSDPMGIAVDANGFVYVTDVAGKGIGYDYGIQKFTSDGVFIMQWGSEGTEPGNISQPHEIAVHPNGNLYVTGYADNMVHVFSPNGDFITRWGAEVANVGEFNWLTGIDIAKDGKVYVSDMNNNRILVFNENGEFITTFGSSGSADGEFNQPYGIAVGDNGNVYVVDIGNNRIQVFTP